MTIKIEGLPAGQTIKHINVDIQFEDGNTKIKTKLDETEPVKTFQPKEPENLQAETTPSGPNFRNIERPQKEIPDEMKDLEF